MKYIKQQNTYKLLQYPGPDIQDTLPPLTYLIRFSDFDGFYLEIIENFSIPKTIYGNTKSLAERILTTAGDRKNNTGVLLVGEKGSGKTLLSKIVCVEAQKQNWPVIIVSEKHIGERFN